MARSALAMVLLGSALACSAPVEHVGEVTSAIVGGEDDSGDPAVVAVVSEALNLTLCSGALIGPRTVLTAGHCNFTNVSVRFGSNAQAPTRSVPVTMTLVHPSYTKEGAPFDFALLELDTPVTDVAPLALRTTPLAQSDVGATVIRHVGFGVSDEATKSGAGHKRTVSYPITRVTDVLVYSGAPGKQTCDNDSGAPGLVRDADGVERIAGVVSDGPSCHEDGWDGRADLAALQSFVQDTRASRESAMASADAGTSDGGSSGGGGRAGGGGGCATSGPHGHGAPEQGAWLLAAVAVASLLRRRTQGQKQHAPHVAITLESFGIVDAGELARVAAAIQRQVTRDFAPAWGIHATVDVFPRLESVPADYWPVVLTRRHLGDDEGFHLTQDGQPFSVVEAIAGWSLTASHEILEMLADPSGARMIEGPRPSFVALDANAAANTPANAAADATPVDYLVEICDPCQSAHDSYVIDGVVVADFVLPAYFDGGAGPYSFTGAVTSPHGLAHGGALTYFDRARRRFVHVRRDDVTDAYRAEDHALEVNDRRPPRAAVHATVKNRSDAPRLGGAEHTLKVRAPRSVTTATSRERAALLRTELASLGTSEPLGLWRASDDDVGERIESALAAGEGAALPPPVVALLEQARRELEVQRASGGRPVAEEQFALSIVRSLAPARAKLLTARDVPGLGTFEHHDVRWAKALLEYAIHEKVPFPVCPISVDPPELTHAISDSAVFAIAGDWGTHNETSARIGGAIAELRPTHTIHLGDVYYAGTDDEERKFVQDWPAGSAGAFTLNSNHEMFSGGHGYFSIALRSEKFHGQTHSYFALHNSKWLFIGIDSGYHATKAGFVPYQIGRLYAEGGKPEDDPQVQWLRRVLAHPLARQANGAPKRLCLFSHHHGLEPHGAENELFAEVRTALEGRLPDVWYWGHVHGAAAYEVPYGAFTFRGRLCAHGGVPYLSELDAAGDAAAHIVWAERPRGDTPGVNGFAMVRVEGDTLVETFHDESGAVQYTTRT